MLYERWRSIAAKRREEFALRDIATGRCWTFGELFAAAEARDPATPDGDSVFPSGHTPEFIFDLLAAWRAGKVVCPLEPEQTKPAFASEISSLKSEIPGCVDLKLTSATTGKPRLIAFTAEQLAADADQIVATMGLRPDWPNLGVISLAHSYGFSNLVLPLLLHGIPLMLAPSSLPEAVRQAAADEPVLTLAAVPALWRAWHQADTIPRNARLAISAGAPLPASLEQVIFAATGLKVHNFYGASECGGIAYDASTTPRADDACVGAPMPGVNLSLDADGCLTVHSHAVGQTYWPEPSEGLGDGVFRTSDLAEIRDGAVLLRGRLADQINVAGRKVCAAVIEQMLLRHPAVGECLAFGVPDRAAGRGETIVACVVAKAAVSAEALRTFLLERLPAWQVPREWWFVESLAANPRGKTSRLEWRQKFLQANPGRVGQA